MKTIVRAGVVTLFAVLAFFATPQALQSIISRTAQGWLVGAASDGSAVYLGADGVGYLKVSPGGAITLENGGTLDDGVAPLVINVKTYGATGDGRQVIDAVTTEDSTTVTSATAGFDSARDVGKIVWGPKRIGGGDGSELTVPLGTIVSVTNSTTIVVSEPAVATDTAISLAWGTNDTEALQAAFLAAFNSGVSGPRPTIYLPAGMYFIDELLGDWRTSFYIPAIVGSGSTTTTFVYKPDFDFDTTFAGKGMIVATSGSAGRYEGFTITGNSFSFGAALKWGILLDGAGASAKDITIHHVQSGPGSSGGLYLNTCGGFEGSNKCVVEDYFTYAMSGFAFLTASSVAVVRNMANYEIEAMQIDNGSHIILEGGNFGDHFNPPDGDSLVVSGGSDVVLYGTRIRHRLKIVDANTSVICNACIIGDIEKANQTAVSVGASTVFRYSASSITSWGTGVWLDVAGTAYDLGGNSYIAGSGSGGFSTDAPYGSTVPTAAALLPTCNAAAVTQHNAVTDSNTIVWGATVAGGGADYVLAFCNGTNWTVAAK